MRPPPGFLCALVTQGSKLNGKDSAQQQHRELRLRRRKLAPEAEEDAMTDPRSWNRRDFDVSVAGYFTVLRPTRWFSALRLPGGFRYRIKGAGPENPAITTTLPPAPGSISSPKLNAADCLAGPETAAPLQLATLSAPERRPIRLLLIVATAIAAMYAMLLWIGNS